MAKTHGAKAQKRAAKKKAKRQAKRAFLIQRSSSDPTIRLHNVAKWPVVRCMVATQAQTQGMGHALIVRREPAGGLVFGLFMLDTYCLGAKDGFWNTATASEIDAMVKKLDQVEDMHDVEPAYLAKLVLGAVEFAGSYGFLPHPDFRHASKLLDGLDPSTCPTEFKYGQDGLPFYIRGPYETDAQAEAIMRVVRSAGGHYMVMIAGDEDDELTDSEHEFDQIETASEHRKLEGPRRP